MSLDPFQKYHSVYKANENKVKIYEIFGGHLEVECWMKIQ